MLGQIGALGKAFVTPLDRTGKRFFVGVNSQMVEEVASFAELLVTAWVLTLHDSSDPPRLYVLVSQYLVVGGVGNMLASTDRVKSLCVF
jgi:hypothetical protein